MKRRISSIATQVAIIAALSPFIWMASDRSPPWIRVAGSLSPSAVNRGNMVQATFIAKLPHDGQIEPRYCPGNVQREIIDSGRNLWPKLTAQTVGVWKPIPDDVEHKGSFTTPPVLVPSTAEKGKAIYRVTTFFYCNWLQRVLNWPIVQTGPDIEFEIRE